MVKETIIVNNYDNKWMVERKFVKENPSTIVTKIKMLPSFGSARKAEVTYKTKQVSFRNYMKSLTPKERAKEYIQNPNLRKPVSVSASKRAKSYRRRKPRITKTKRQTQKQIYDSLKSYSYTDAGGIPRSGYFSSDKISGIALKKKLYNEGGTNIKIEA